MGINGYLDTTESLNFQRELPACPDVLRVSIPSIISMVVGIRQAGFSIYGIVIMEYIAVRNWEKFQHYSKRNPPWIKVHQSILTNYEFQQLTDAERYLLIGLWLLASRTANMIPMDTRYIRDILRLSTRRIQLEKLISLNFIYIIQGDKSENASKMLATIDRDRDRDRDRVEKSREEKTSVRSNQRSKRTKKGNPEIKIFIDWYSEEHLKIIKNKYVVQGVKDATAVKRLLGTLSLDELKIRAMRFLEDLKSWPDNDKKITHLENQINKYGGRNGQTGAYKQDSKYPEPDVVAE